LHSQITKVRQYSWCFQGTASK